MAYQINRRFNEDIFRLKVGSTQHVFKVHQQILARSPVLARMTISGFSESITKEIILPEDNEDTFGRIIEFLYGNEHDAFNFGLLNESESVEKLTDMFVLADKYDLFNIQCSIIDKLEKVKLLKENRMAFFNTVYRITRDSQDSYGPFRAFFTKKAVAHLKSLTTEEIKKLSEMAESEGTFASWMFDAQAKLYQDDQRKWSEEIQKTTAELRNTEAKLNTAQAGISSLKAALEKHPADFFVKIQWVLEVLAAYTS